MTAPPSIHPDRALGVALFNECWRLLTLPSRTAAEDSAMLSAAHASLHHWSQPGAGATPRHLATGEWQVARVYATLGWAEPAVWYSRRAVERAERHGLTGFDLAFVHEGLARSLAAAGDREARQHHERAKALLASIEDDEDRAVVEADLAGITLP